MPIDKILRSLFLFTIFGFIACGEDPMTKEEGKEEEVFTKKEVIEDAYERIALMPIEDHFELDSILIHNTYELSEGHFMMVSRASEDSFIGLQMHLYTLMDSLPIVSASSTPAYDSWIYLPTFFVSSDRQDTLLLAEIGERESWGARLLRIHDGVFVDLGFIDIALRDHKFDEELETDVMFLKSVASNTSIKANGEGLIVSFGPEPLHIYDDQLGNADTLYPADQVIYEFSDSLRLKIKESV